jgi:hypothetical protein
MSPDPSRQSLNLLQSIDSPIIAQRDAAIGQMEFARSYTLNLLADIQEDEWYIMPSGAPSHLAWQVGHLAVAQYGLMLFRQRGRAEGDLDLMPGWLRKQFGRGSKPAPKEELKITISELLDAFHRINKQAMQEVIDFSAELLSEPTEMPYAVHPIKLGALLFCPLHESIHAGQIGLIRRLLGKDPVR